MIYIHPEEVNTKIRELATEKFLATLTELAKIYGWESDYTEVVCFVEWIYDKAKKERPNLQPYDYDEADNLIIP